MLDVPTKNIPKTMSIGPNNTKEPAPIAHIIGERVDI
jgi:hypothetical protein